jgi:hypothetical protein
MRSARSLSFLAVAAVLATGATASAADEVVSETEAPTRASNEPELPWLGLMTDVGIPDGMQASIVLRPERWLRASVSGGYNLISKGVGGGLTILPFGRGPSISFEGGHYFDGDASAAAARLAGPAFSGSSFMQNDSALIQRVGYDYANLQLGLDFGYERVTFFIHGGMSYVQGKVHNVDTLVQSNPAINGVDANGLEVSIKGDPTVKYIGPSAKIGLIVYLW